MSILENYRLRFAGLSLVVDRLQTEHTHSFDRGSRKSFPSVMYVTGGVCEIRAIGGWLTVKQGDCVYMPEGLRYHSVWSGTPEISHYCIHIYSARGINNTASDVPLQRIDALSAPRTGERFAGIFSLASKETTVTDLEALSLFFGLYSDISKNLRREAPMRYHQELFRAMKYIEDNYTRDVPMEELAGFTYLSESRLYHLFQSQLRTTPTKYRNHLRIEKAAELLSSSDIPMEELAAASGFESMGYFRQVFKEYTGLTPYEYRTRRDR